MANKLPWMKHDHNARNDLFIKKLEERFGHFGYAAWFKTLEVLHEHGVGDNLCISMSRYASEIGTKPPTARHLLSICQSSGKVCWSESGKDINITVKNFRKKQGKKFLKEDSNQPEEGSKLALDVDVEEEGDKDKLGFLEKIKRLAGGFRVRPWTDSDLESHQFPFGKERGRRVVDMEPSRCEWYLGQIEMDPKTTAALKHRIKLKQSEAIK